MIQLGPVHLTDDSERVTDADEEVFLLYTALQAHPIPEDAHRGLGFLDSHHDTIEVVIELDGDSSASNVGSPSSSGPSTPASEKFPTPNSKASTERPRNSALHSGGKHRSTRHVHTRKPIKPLGPQSVQVELYQDKTRLHTTKGDTGSVLWRASIDFARMVLRQYHHRSPESFFERGSLSELRVLELGAGTGLLPVLLAPLVKHYTATDIAGLKHLISKNVHLNAADHDLSNVVVETLDWEQLHSTSVSRRRKAFPYVGGGDTKEDSAPHDAHHHARHKTDHARHKTDHARHGTGDTQHGTHDARNGSNEHRNGTADSRDESDDAPDLILAVDCIYHPSLVGPLVSTINHFARPDRTIVVVVSELRAEDVLRGFLEAWLGSIHGDSEDASNSRRGRASDTEDGRAGVTQDSGSSPYPESGEDGARWEIWHAGDGTDGPGLLGVPYVTWVGRKVSVSKV